MASSANPRFWETVGFVFRVAFRSVPACIPVAMLFAVPLTVAVVVGTAVSERLTAIAPRILDAPLPVLVGAIPVFIVLCGSLVLLLSVVYPLVAGGLAWIGTTTASGGRTTIAAAMGRIAERGPAALGAYLLGMLAVMAAPAALALLAFVSGIALGVWAALGFGLLSVISVFYPASVLLIRFSLAPAVAMTEEVGAGRALARSSELVRGAFLWIVGVLLVTSAASAMVSAAVSSPFAAAGGEGMIGLIGGGVGQLLGTVASVWFAGVTAGVLYLVRASRAGATPAVGDL